MMNNKFLIVALSALAFSLASCSNDDPPGDPAGSVTVNMMNESNGKTMLGDSGVYIDDANNFVGQTYSFADLGATSGLGAVSTPVLDGRGPQAAVVPGHAYQMFRTDAVRDEFPSGKKALNIAADYCHVYVVSEIKKDDKVTGAMVKYVMLKVPEYGLPEYGSTEGTLTYLDPLEIPLSTSDFEYEIDSSYNISAEKQGSKLVLHIEGSYEPGSFGVYLRIATSYTYVKVDLQYPR